MSTPVLVGIVVAAVAIGALLGAAVLFALASGDGGPRRFGVTMPDPDFFDKAASFAVTAQISVPGPVERVWAQVSEGGYLDSIPLSPARSGPETGLSPARHCSPSPRRRCITRRLASW